VLQTVAANDMAGFGLLSILICPAGLRRQN